MTLYNYITMNVLGCEKSRSSSDLTVAQPIGVKAVVYAVL